MKESTLLLGALFAGGAYLLLKEDKKTEEPKTSSTRQPKSLVQQSTNIDAPFLPKGGGTQPAADPSAAAPFIPQSSGAEPMSQPAQPAAEPMSTAADPYQAPPVFLGPMTAAPAPQTGWNTSTPVETSKPYTDAMGVKYKCYPQTQELTSKGGYDLVQQDASGVSWLCYKV